MPAVSVNWKKVLNKTGSRSKTGSVDMTIDPMTTDKVPMQHDESGNKEITLSLR